MSEERAFLQAIEAALGSSPSRCLPGQLVRFSTNGKRNDTSGWARLFDDGQGGVFGDWRTGVVDSWQAGSRSASLEDRALQRRHIDGARNVRAAEEAERHEAASLRALAIWNRSASVARHAYADKKGFVPGPGLRVTRAHLAGASGQFYVTGDEGRSERLKGDLLLVPMFGIDRRLWSLQAIDQAGRKSFLKGGRTRGLFYVVGSKLLRDIEHQTFAGDIAIAEGVATGFAVHQLSGFAVFVAFNAGNLLHVAQAVRQRFPAARVTVAGDVDRSGVGQIKAEQAASTVSGFVSLPPFTGAEVEAGASDWNDYVRLHPDGQIEEMQA